MRDKKIDVYLADAIAETEPDLDRAPLDAALREAGISFEWHPWKGASVDWSRARVCFPRSTWDYHLDYDRFLGWAAHVDAVGNLRNSSRVIAWNTHKRYLVELAESGIPVVPTRCVPRGSAESVRDIRAAEGWGRVVIKPAVSCASWQTFPLAAEDDGEPHWSRLLAERDMLVQPFVDAVNTSGERSVIVIDGVVTHVVRKNPRFDGEAESVDGPFDLAPAEDELVRAVLARVDEPLAYARVDMVFDAAGAPMVAELELVEPSLFFRFSDESLRRFVQMVERQLQQS